MLNIMLSAKSVSATSANTSDSASKSSETKSKKTRKRRRETGDSTGNSPQDSVRITKKEKKKAKTMENKDINTQNCIHKNNEVTLSEEMQQMEKRITDNITNHNQVTMKSLIQDTMKEMIKPIQDSTDNLLVLKTNMEMQEGRITQIKQENMKLNNELNQLKSEKSNFHQKINQLEDRFLERNLIFQGITEALSDDEEA